MSSALVERPEEKVFLATQIADEARHQVFFDRFLRETCGMGHDMSSTLQSVRPDLSWGYLQVFAELERICARLRQRPRDKVLLTQRIVLYHLVIEGMLAHTGLHFLSDFAKRNQILPGFTAGMKQVIRDESHHIAFGIQILRHEPRAEATGLVPAFTRRAECIQLDYRARQEAA